jgi:general secretion pathway protein G
MRRASTRRHRIQGFTLIELLLVMVILAILAAVVVPKLVGRSDQAKVAAAKSDISSLEGALSQFEVDTGRFPSSDEGLVALTVAPANVNNNWHGPYLMHPPKDPWGQQYVYVYPGQHNVNGFDLYTTMGGKDSSGNELNNWNINSGQ